MRLRGQGEWTEPPVRLSAPCAIGGTNFGSDERGCVDDSATICQRPELLSRSLTLHSVSSAPGAVVVDCGVEQHMVVAGNINLFPLALAAAVIYISQTAASKYGVPNGGNTVRNGHADQIVASIKCTASNAGDTDADNNSINCVTLAVPRRMIYPTTSIVIINIDSPRPADGQHPV